MRDKHVEAHKKEGIIEDLINIKGKEIFKDFLDGEGVETIKELKEYTLTDLMELKNNYLSFVDEYGIDDEDEYDDEY